MHLVHSVLSGQSDRDVRAAYLSTYDSVEETTPIRSTDWTAHGDYVFNICMDREDFQAIPNIL